MLLLALALALPQDPATTDIQRFEYMRLAMGSIARIVVWADDEAAARDACRDAFATVNDLDDVLSDWKATSEVARLAEHAGGAAVPISAELGIALALGLELAAATDGAFDVTVGPLTRLWRACRTAGREPTAAELNAARALVGWRDVRLDHEAGTARLMRTGMALDFGALGKGLACDRALARLAQAGFPRALVELGGDLALGNPPPGRAGWTVAVRCGAAEGDTLELANCGIATSGDTEQALAVDASAPRSHILDPARGFGLVAAPCVTVIAASAARADALATAVSVLGPRAGAELVAAQGARLLTTDERATRLFDGTSLAGWVTRGGRYDGNAVWSVEDGALTGRVGPNREGGLIYTERPFTSFQFTCEALVDEPFDSGVFVRMAPQGKGAQITLDVRPDGEVGAVYADGYLAHNEDGKRLWRSGEWNRVDVRCTGFDMHLEAWLNDAPLIDYRLPEGTPGFAPTGLIGLQVHGGRDDPLTHAARFRNVSVRELALFEEAGFEAGADGLLALGANARGDGWIDLLADGLEAWEASGTSEGYRVDAGVLSIPAKGGGQLATRADFEDFRLRLDFSLAKGANSGLFLRAARDGTNPAYSGCELQLLDDHHWEELSGDELKDWQFTASLYGAVPAGNRDVLRPPGEWNTLEVLCVGQRLAVALNGRTLYDVDTHALEVEPPFAQRATSGFLGLQRYGSPHVKDEYAARFKNVFVQPLER